MVDYVPVLLFLLVATLVPVAILATAWVLRPSRYNPVKSEAYECGVPALGNARERFSVKFYMVAVSFIIFDVELVFLFPWAVVFRDLGWYGMLAMTPFLVVLAVGLAYEWMRGGLEWE